MRNNNSSRWISPLGVAKINVDAAISKNRGLDLVAAVARDCTGNFLGASALVVEGVTDPQVMEAIAYWEGVALAKDLLLQKIKMASDCNNVVKRFMEEAMGLHY
jgi:ribonuclease HI